MSYHHQLLDFGSVEIIQDDVYAIERRLARGVAKTKVQPYTGRMMSKRDTGLGGVAATTWLSAGQFGLLLGVVLVLCFPRVILGTHSFYYRDYGALGYPLLFFARESFWRGEFPFWLPLIHCGVPFMAQWGTMALYPLSVIYLVLPMPWSLGVFCLGHLWLAGYGMYHLASRWTGHGMGASLAGLAFVFNGYTLSCLIWPNYTAALGWMPWVVLLAERAWREGRGSTVVAGGVGALQLLTGVPEILLMTWLTVGVVWLADLSLSRTGVAMATESSAHKRAANVGLMAGRLLVVVLLAACLAAAQLLPFLDLLKHSHREAGTMSSKWAMPIWGWANVIVPFFHTFKTPQGQVFQHGQEFQQSYYLGAGVVVLALIGICSGLRSRGPWLGVLGLFGLVMALGEQTPIYRWIGRALPVIELVRYPVKFVALAAFVTPILAAMGFSFLLRQTKRRRVLITLAVVAGGVLILIALVLWHAYAHPMPYDRWPMTLGNTLVRTVFLLFLPGVVTWLVHLTQSARLADASEQASCPSANVIEVDDGFEHARRHKAGAGKLVIPGLLLLACVIGDGITHQMNLNPTLPVARFMPGVWEQAFTAPPPRFGESRLMTTRFAEDQMLHSPVQDPDQEWMGKRLAQWSNLNILDNIPKVPGSATLRLRAQQEVQRALYVNTNHSMMGLLDFLGVSQITAPGEVVQWSGRATFMPLVTVGQRPVFVASSNTLEYLLQEDFNPRAVVVLTDEAAGRIGAGANASARVITTNLSNNRIECEVETDKPAMLVVAQSYYHRWRAFVNGVETPIWRANHAFQALEVPSGVSRVVVEYQDKSFWFGLALGLSALTACLVHVFRLRHH